MIASVKPGLRPCLKDMQSSREWTNRAAAPQDSSVAQQVGCPSTEMYGTKRPFRPIARYQACFPNFEPRCPRNTSPWLACQRSSNELNATCGLSFLSRFSIIDFSGSAAKDARLKLRYFQ